jgi:hypothetical protein
MPTPEIVGFGEMAKTDQSTAEAYHLRPYQSRDRDRFLSLYETVWGRKKSVDWFEWRFESNPYQDGVQMIVAESSEELVGVEPLVPFRLQIGETTYEASQPVDWMVHPDHRRCGLFTRMTEAVLEQYLPDVSLFFNFPNEHLQPGLRKFDWQTVGPVACRYRVQNTRAFVEAKNANQHSTPVSIAGKLARPVVRAGLGLFDRFGSPPSGITVDRFTDVPVETIHERYSSARPNRIHVPRNRPFLRWRFANPNWETTSYVASRDGEPVASIIAATEQIENCRITHLLDSQPMSRQSRRPAAFEALLAELVSDASDSDLLRAPAHCYPQVFRRYGFFRDDTFPLSTVSTQTTHTIRTPPATAGATRNATQEATKNGGSKSPTDSISAVDLGDPKNWLLTVADLDIA